jgi:prevent-host-death family protein
MKIVPLAEVKAKLSQYLDEAATDGPVIITRNGRAAAVLLAPKNDDDLERLILANSPKFQALLERSQNSVREGHGLSHDEFWAQVDAEAVITSGATKKRGAARGK